jgi:hypothetical protein
MYNIHKYSVLSEVIKLDTIVALSYLFGD